jgi:hypothetical protein
MPAVWILGSKNSGGEVMLRATARVPVSVRLGGDDPERVRNVIEFFFLLYSRSRAGTPSNFAQVAGVS